MRFQLAAVSGELHRLIYVLLSQCLLPEACPVRDDPFYLGIIQLFRKKKRLLALASSPEQPGFEGLVFLFYFFFQQTNLFTISLVLKQK